VRGSTGQPNRGELDVYELARDYTVQMIEISLIVVLAVAAAIAVRNRPRWRYGLEPPATCLAIGSLLAILVSTVSRRGDSREPGTIQLVPLRTLSSYRYDHSDLLIYVIGNVALFVPLGFFLYLALRRWLLVTTLVTAMVSVGVEILQIPIWTRSSDIDDVLTNTAGGFIGALAGVAALRLYRTAQPHVSWLPRRETQSYAEGSRAS
jgi:hypothetical protein